MSSNDDDDDDGSAAPCKAGARQDSMPPTIANPLFDPLQADVPTPTLSRNHSAYAPRPAHSDVAATPVDDEEEKDAAQASDSPDDDLFGSRRVSRVFDSTSRSSLFGGDDGEDDDADDGEAATHGRGSARQPRWPSGETTIRASRHRPALGLGVVAAPRATPSRRAVSQASDDSRAPTPLPDHGGHHDEDADGTEPSWNLLATLHRMQDADIARQIRAFASSSTSAAHDGRRIVSDSSRSSSESRPGQPTSTRSRGTLELPEASTPSEAASRRTSPARTDQSGSSPSAATSKPGSRSEGAQQPSREGDTFAFVRHLSLALSTALQSAQSAEVEVDALTDEHNRALDNMRRESEAREQALRALCSQHGIKPGEIDRALMRASPLQQELESRKTAGVSPAHSGFGGNVSGLLSPPLAAPHSSGPKSEERFADPEADALSAGGLSALHESLQEAMQDDLERSPTTVNTSQLGNLQSASLSAGSERSMSPALSSVRHRRNSSKSTIITSRTRETSPGALSTRSGRSQRPPSVSSTSVSEATGTSKTSAPSTSSKSAGAAATAAATLTRAFWRTKKSPASSAASSLNAKVPERPAQPNLTRLPSMFAFSTTPSPSTTSQKDPAGSKSAAGGQVDAAAVAGSETAAPKTVELDFMLPSDAKPPTYASLTRRDPVTGSRTPSSSRVRREAGPGGKEGRKGSSSSEEESSGDEFEVYGGKGALVPPRPVFSEVGSDILTPQLLTDRYGFVYDATPADIKLLREARKASSSAPACLTGIRVGMRARGMDDSDEGGLTTDQEASVDADETEDEQEVVSNDDRSEASSQAEGSQARARNQTIRAGGASTFKVKTTAAPAMLTLDLPPSLDFDEMDALAKSGQLSPNKPAKAPGLTPLSEAKPVIEASVILAESKESGGLGPTSPSQELEFKLNGGTSAGVSEAGHGESQTRRRRRAPPSTSQTVRKLLGHLQSMHDEQQARQQSEWDAFLKRRKERQLAAATTSAQTSAKSAHRMSRVFGAAPTPVLATSPSETSPADEELLLGLVGMQRLGETKAGKEDWAELQRLCRRGIPLCYRGAIWKECSGATEVVEPGRYEELLSEHEGETNECLTQIDLDVHRTMPTNIFFGGNGPGVPKLRRVLVAFSWYDPVCGYCQGMNNLAATLLLTLPNEEDAFWTLVCIISKILPAEYYTSHLLVSQADQRVLVELVDEHIPKLAEHMRELGVDLPAVTFAWFLSLYTDCLPVETLFRVWDMLFIDGMVVLFRIAMAILLLSEADLLATSGPAAFYGHMHSLTSRMFSVDRLMKLACEDLVQSIKYSDIQSRRERHVKDLRVELGLDTSNNNA